MMTRRTRLGRRRTRSRCGTGSSAPARPGNDSRVAAGLLAQACQDVTEVAESLQQAASETDGRPNDGDGVQSPAEADADGEDDLDDLDGHAETLSWAAQERIEQRAWAARLAGIERADRAEACRRVEPAGLGVFDPGVVEDVLSGRRAIPRAHRARWAELLEEVRDCYEQRLKRFREEREPTDRRQAAAVHNLLQGGSAGLLTACRLEASGATVGAADAQHAVGVPAAATGAWYGRRAGLAASQS